MESKNRCEWVPLSDQLYMEYHDKEWGTPEHSDKKLFESLILQGAQAGLSWKTILYKRDNFRIAYDYFDPVKISKFDGRRVNELMQNRGIIRNKLKIMAAVENSKAFLRVQNEFGSFDEYIWKFVNYETLQNSWYDIKQIPAMSHESAAMSKDLYNRGFRFVGSTICYAYMQAMGMVNDHTTACYRHSELRE